jgi:hypothetical protein
MTDQTTTISVSTSEADKLAAGTQAAATSPLADAAWFMLYAFIAIFVVSALVTLVRSRKGPKK